MTATASGAIRLRRREVETLRRLCVVTEPLTVTEWADRYRVLPETSTAPGAYRSSTVPYARRWQDLLADPDVSTVVLCWASQTTKSTVLENGLGYRIHRAPSPILVLRPKIDDAESWAKERLVPMIISTPVLRERVRLGRSTDSTLRYKRFPGGFLFVASAQSATEVASRSAPFVLVDEADRMEVIPGEGNPVEIVARRMGASDVGLLAITSTPRDAETTIIWPYLEGGTYELYEVPCPHCAVPQALRWPQLKWPGGNPEAAEYVCVHCDRPINEREKPGMLAAGEWVATNPDGQYPSSHLNALYSPFARSGWGVLAREFVRAHGKPADLQVFVNTRLSELWTETESKVSPDQLLERLDEGMEAGIVPDGVGAVTLGIDVQDNRIEAYAWGWGAGIESWMIQHWLLPGDTSWEPVTPNSVWRALEPVIRTTFRHVNGGTVPILASFIDSGHQTTQVYRFAAALRGLNVFASKGQGGPYPILGKPTLQTAHRYILYPIGTDTAKNEFLRSQIVERTEGPGYVHLPGWLTTDQTAQLVAEERKRRIHRGRVVYEWRRKGGDAPNEALDCRIYARAALELLGPTVIATLAERARALAALAPAEASVQTSAQRGRRVRSRGVDF